MTPEELRRRAVALGRRAVACRRWRWMPGMRIRGIDKLCVGVTANKGCPMYRDGYGNYDFVSHAEPDLTDPATLGCLLALVREAYPKHTLWVAPVCVEDPLDDTEFILDEPRAFTVMGSSEVSCYVTGLGRGRTEAEALVAALEATEGRG